MAVGEQMGVPDRPGRLTPVVRAGGRGEGDLVVRQAADRRKLISVIVATIRPTSATGSGRSIAPYARVTPGNTSCSSCSTDRPADHPERAVVQPLRPRPDHSPADNIRPTSSVWALNLCSGSGPTARVFPNCQPRSSPTSRWSDAAGPRDDEGGVVDGDVVGACNARSAQQHRLDFEVTALIAPTAGRA